MINCLYDLTRFTQTGLITGEPYLVRDDTSGNSNVEWMFGIMISQRVSTIFYYYGLGVLLLTITVKFILFLICRQVKHSPSVIAYAFDHRNDVLSNTVLVISVFLSKMLWWFDSLGATILSIYIIKSWIEESMEHSKCLKLNVHEPPFVNYFQNLSHM